MGYIARQYPNQVPQSLVPMVDPRGFLSTRRQSRHFGIHVGIQSCPVLGERATLQQFASDHFLILIIKTTWDFHEFTKLPVGKEINENLVSLPNMNALDDAQVAYVGQVLTKYCESLEEMTSSNNNNNNNNKSKN